MAVLKYLDAPRDTEWLKIDQIYSSATAMSDLMLAVVSSFGFVILTAAGFYISDLVFNHEVDEFDDLPCDDDLLHVSDVAASGATVPLPRVPVPSAPIATFDHSGWELVDMDSDVEDAQIFSPGRNHVRRINSRKASKLHHRRWG